MQSPSEAGRYILSLTTGSWDGDPAVASGPLDIQRVGHPKQDAVIGVRERDGSLAACFQNRWGRAYKRLDEVADIFWSSFPGPDGHCQKTVGWTSVSIGRSWNSPQGQVNIINLQGRRELSRATLSHTVLMCRLCQLLWVGVKRHAYFNHSFHIQRVK